ncbi:MAG: hypothetical protein K0S47_397 [Herbinix sp.]|jgi:hypothetical protein|nr:hypothetical protein [Herbinix sp.]
MKNRRNIQKIMPYGLLFVSFEERLVIIIKSR